MQTKNKGYNRNLLNQLNQKDKFDALASEIEAGLDSEMVKQIALFEFDDMASQKYSVFKTEERWHTLANQIV